MPCGTSGEGPLLDAEEMVAIVETVVDEARGGARTIAHVGGPATAATERLARRSIASGADAVAAVVPYYYPWPDAAIALQYKRLLKAVEATPLFAYTIPARTGNELTPDVFRALAEDGLAGVKDSTKSLERHAEYLAAARSVRGRPPRVLMGSDGLVLDAIRQGGDGCVSALANVRPDLLLALRGAAARDDWARAREIQDELLDLRRHGTSSIAALKAELGRHKFRWRPYPASLRAPGSGAA
jgi:dihydrodipicolinate synthase/N-acetylneuraminate lyase